MAAILLPLQLSLPLFPCYARDWSLGIKEDQEHRGLPRCRAPVGFWMFVLLMIGTVCSGMSLLGVSGLGYQGRLADHLGTDLCPALDRVLYHLLWGKTPQCGKNRRVRDRAGLSCPPVREPDCPAVTRRSCRYHRLADLPCRTILPRLRSSSCGSSRSRSGWHWSSQR